MNTIFVVSKLKYIFEAQTLFNVSGYENLDSPKSHALQQTVWYRKLLNQSCCARTRYDGIWHWSCEWMWFQKCNLCVTMVAILGVVDLKSLDDTFWWSHRQGICGVVMFDGYPRLSSSNLSRMARYSVFKNEHQHHENDISLNSSPPARAVGLFRATESLSENQCYCFSYP